VFSVSAIDSAHSSSILVGFAETDITPQLGGKPLYMAGFGHDRVALGIHDQLKARAVVISDNSQKIAIVSLDLIGFFYESVLRIRKQLPLFDYVLITSTHNHEGPDTLGLWGPNLFQSGLDPSYQQYVEHQAVQAVTLADAKLLPAKVLIASAQAPELLRDSREPYIKHDELVALQFLDPDGKKSLGIVVQWNCHPETLSAGNRQISADFVGYTVDELSNRRHCPVVYLTGTVGGLMTSLGVPVSDDQGRILADGTFQKTDRYGKLIGRLADRALSNPRAIPLHPVLVKRREVFLPLQNPAFQAARTFGVLRREAYAWANDSSHAEPARPGAALAVRTEVAWLRLGQLDVAAIPGEIYPELVLNKVQDPPDPAADFPDAPIEPAIYQQLPGPFRMIIGLANDELGYIIPKRQWDEKPPFCYGRKEAQYGEINSLGPDAAPILCDAFRRLVQGQP
jgi:hypothetical protein